MGAPFSNRVLRIGFSLYPSVFGWERPYVATVVGLVALHQDYDVGRYISVERIIEQSKDSYYDTLLASSQGWHEGKHDVWPWTEYFLGTLLAAYSDFESKFGRISKGRGSKTDTIRNAIDGFIADFSITDLERACPMVSRDMIRHVLGDLRKSKIIVPIGRGRGAKWRKAGK